MGITGKPWFFGLEHVTRDHQGYVYWKGIRIEHYDHDVWQRPGWRERMKADAIRFARICTQLEAAGVRPSLSDYLEVCDKERETLSHG